MGIHVKKGKLFLPKLKQGIKIKLHRPLEGRIICGTVSKTPTGKYFVSITVEKEIEKLPKIDTKVGIDLGLKDFVILSNGEKIENPKFKRTQLKKLKFLHRQLSKKKKASAKKAAPAKKAAIVVPKAVMNTEKIPDAMIAPT